MRSTPLVLSVLLLSTLLSLTVGQVSVVSTVFYEPYGITFDGTHLYVSESSADYVGKLTLGGTLLANFSAFSPALHLPRGMAAGPDGRLYVADELNERIVQFTSSGLQLQTYPNLSLPFGVAISGTNVWVANSGSDQGLEISQAGVLEYFTPQGALHSPFGICVDPTSQDVYILSTRVGTLLKYSHDNGTVSTVYSGLDSPEACTVDWAGNVFIANTNGNNIVQLAADGTRVGSLDTSSLTPSLLYPTGLTLDYSGNLYVAEFGNGRVLSLANVATPRPATSSSSAAVVPPVSSSTGTVPALSSGSFCFVAYGLAGTVDYPWSVATQVNFQYDPATVTTAEGTAVRLVSGTGTRVFTNKFGQQIPSTVSVSSATDDLLYVGGSSPVDASGITLDLSAPVQLPGVGADTTFTSVKLFQANGSLGEGPSTRIDPQGQAFVVTNVPGVVDLTIGASNINHLAVDTTTCTATISFTNGLRPPTQPSKFNGAQQFNYAYTVGDGVTFSVFANLTITTNSAFATKTDQLGNPFQAVTDITGTRTYTYLSNSKSIVSTVSFDSTANTQRFYPYAFLVSSPAVYTINTAPFLDADGLTYTISPAAPLDGTALSSAQTTSVITVAVVTENQSFSHLQETPFVSDSELQYQQQTYVLPGQ